MLNPNFFNTYFIIPILNVLVILYKGFLFLKLPGAFGFAVIGLTVLVRLALHPFFKQQLEMSKKMQDMKPHLDKLSQQHKNDKSKLQQEQLKLYQQAGINPASGCLFMIVQIPVFIGLYNTLSLFLMNGSAAKVIADINKALYWPILKIQAIDPWFFGFNLAVTPEKGGQWFYYLIPVLTGVLQYLQVKVSMPATQPLTSEVKETKPARLDTNNSDRTLQVDKNKDSSGDFQKAMNTQMKFIFPLMIGWFSYTLPVGLSLYWNIFSLFSIMQYRNLKTQSSNLKTTTQN